MNIQETQSTTKTDSEIRAEYQNISDNFKPLTDVAEFTGSVQTTENTYEFQFNATNLFGVIENMTLLKLKTNENSLEFTYASEQETNAVNYVDGTWWVTDPANNESYLAESDALDSEQTYTIHYVIQDDGDYDLDTTEGNNTIKDPTVIGTTVEGSTSDSTSDSDGSSSSSSGCFINTLIQ